MASKQTRRANPADLTLRNLRALKGRVESLENEAADRKARDARIASHMTAIQAHLAVVLRDMPPSPVAYVPRLARVVRAKMSKVCR